MSNFPADAIKDLLLQYGIRNPKRAELSDPTEEVVLASASEIGNVDIDEVSLKLRELMPGRKVWLVQDGMSWRGTPF